MDVSAQDIDGKMANASLRVRLISGLYKCNCFVVEKEVNGIHLFHYKPYMVKMWYISSQTTGIYVLLKCKVRKKKIMNLMYFCFIGITNFLCA